MCRIFDMLHANFPTCLDVCSHPYPLFLPPMSCEIIHRDFHALALFEFAQSMRQQIKVKGIRVVEVIVVAGGQGLLVFRQDLRVGRCLC